MTAVLDASAVLAWVRSERGAEVVTPYLTSATISAVNVSEVHQKLAQHGVDANRTITRLRTVGMKIEPVALDDAIAAARLWPVTRAAGLSLGDRCCLALAARLDVPALTADGTWSTLDIGVTVVAIRPGSS